MRIWSLIFSLLLSHSILAKDLPNSINITYDLSFEKKPLGSIDVKYRKDKSRYKIIASSNFLGAMNLLGNYQLISSGHIKGNHYFPDSIVRKNLKKDKQTITTIDYKKELIQIQSEKKSKEYQLKKGTQDVLSYFFEFNGLEKLEENHSFFILDSHDYKKYTYRKIKEENLKINDRFIECIKYQGRVNDEELTHDIWLSKKNHIPVRIITPTPIGLVVDQLISKGNIFNLL
jgi:hypothetical protein